MVVAGLGAVALIWGAVWVTLTVAGRFEPTPEKVARFVENHPVEGRSPAEREEIVRQVARRINQLDFEQRREWRGRRGDGDARDRPGFGGGDPFFDSLTDEEKVLFIELTMDAGFQRMMEAFNAMTPERRRQFVDRTLRDLERDEGRDDAREELEKLDPDLYDKMVSSGLEAFYRDADADVKMDLAPVLERMQDRIRRGR